MFVVNGIAVVDSRNPLASQTNTTVYSLVIVPGSNVFDTRAAPHGGTARATSMSRGAPLAARA